ncbi:MAG: UDP-N-acetylglucosamine 4,6-dehydratase (inverting) [Alphaproteobacteria bacterium]|nr:UDP-N-acetylglucosamine 4,6-dehydratase (inverting) [Alphaproteobacteria bacterium]
MSFSLDDKTILVTGGTGSFGRRLIATILTRYRPRKVIVFSRDETKQWEMALESPFNNSDVMRFFIGDVRDFRRLELAFKGVDYVVHAAALKHITIAEYNPFECIQTNVHGAENVVQAAMSVGVKRVIGLSTDKAANPINLYGASKLASDKIFAAAKHIVGSGDPLFSVVRYGNVVDSRGSVVPLFRKLIGQGATSLPITDPRMTRFWITLQQGVDFVLSCFDIMIGGEIFVPKIPSMKVVDLANSMAPQLAHDVVGIRPGEKLHESMITEDDSRNTLELPDRYIIVPAIFGGDRQYHADQRVVPEGFSYVSDTNPQWLSSESLREVLGES